MLFKQEHTRPRSPSVAEEESDDDGEGGRRGKRAAGAAGGVAAQAAGGQEGEGPGGGWGCAGMEEQRALPDEPPPSPSLPPSWPSSRPATPLPPTPVSLVRDLSGGALGAAGEENPSEGDSNARSRSRPASPSWSEGDGNAGDAHKARAASPSWGMGEFAGESVGRERRGGCGADAAGGADTHCNGMVAPGKASDVADVMQRDDEVEVLSCLPI